MICIPIAAATTDTAILRMGRAALLAGLVELRIDRIPAADLERLLTARRPPVIVTNRSRQEGGGFAGTEEERVERLKEAVRLGADYVDIETATDPALKSGLREAIVGTSAKLIVSWHDFSGTPPSEFLKFKLEECMADGPAIAKIVTRADDVSDCLRVLELIPFARQRGQAIIAFCMGRPGKISRIMAPLLGSVIAYASLEAEEASAPGQMTIHQMREINRLLEEGSCNE
ncbi:MAG: type I 3-dehydroquinate dehydratase [Syntrophus sp. RIFOXYC2_FULL_54_9]|nr:MAG: type I 3-dehydroquinate dehydratase [Syntrophus sp. GWC2_56_31]OHE32633.1 MAG: type I 3-dehydroquinate dehydratase [Syntrophus sp. RIFOXYC2_FULL_54_9]HBB15484.1 type I 3-dehydroquinate dehydratase [Syntrophus sp. (in: bacteria)]